MSIDPIFFSYPSTFIENEFYKFFFEYNCASPFLPFSADKKQYFIMRQKILGRPTARKSQVTLSASRANIDNDQTDDQTDENPVETSKPTTEAEKKQKHYDNKKFVHYTHEQRFNSFKRDMHHVYEDIFKDTPAMNAKIIVGNRNRRDAKNELIRKRPPKRLLRNQLTHRKYQ